MQRSWVVSPEYRSVIDAIRKVRTQKGVSQRELGRRLGKPTSFINKIEQLERRLDILEFIAMAEALEMKPSDLIHIVRKGLPEIISL